MFKAYLSSPYWPVTKRPFRLMCQDFYVAKNDHLYRYFGAEPYSTSTDYRTLLMRVRDYYRNQR